MTSPSDATRTWQLDDLIAESGWAHALARNLVRSAADADDAVQEALLAAGHKLPGREQPLRPWFAAVLRNVVRMQQRAAARRRRREAVHAQQAEHSLPAAGELVQKAEAQQQLVQAVLRLDEPFRETVLLHFFEDLSSAEIARRQGIPAGTVRWRVKRGLDQLRDDFDARHGDRRAWCLLLAPLARPPAASLALSSMTLSALGLMIMKWMTVSAALGGLFWFGAQMTGLLGSDPVLLRDESQPREELGYVAWRPEPGVRSGLPAGSEPVVPRPEVAPLGTLTARCVDGGDVPLPGVNLRVFHRTGFGAELGEPAQSGADGTVACRVAVPPRKRAETEVLLVRAERPGYATVIRELRMEPGGEVALGTLRMAPGGALHGRVVDVTGQPVADAELWIPARDLRQPGPARRVEFRSDDRGGFRVTGLPVGLCQVYGKEGLRRGQSGLVEVRGGQQSRRPLVLVLGPPAPGTGLQGVVLDPEGQPLPDARVSLAYAGEGRSGTDSTQSDAQGRFRFDPVPVDACRVMASHGDYRAVAQSDLDRGSFVVLRLQPPTRLRVFLHGSDGQPVSRAEVQVVASGLPRQDLAGALRTVGFVLGHHPERATASGWLDVPGPGVPYRLQVDAPGYALFESPLKQAVLGEEELHLQLAAVPVLRGRVVTDSGPVAGARVTMHAAARWYTEFNGFETRVLPAARAEVRSDAAGEFVISLRDDEPLLLRVTHPDFAPWDSKPRPRSAWARAAVRVELGRGGALEGRLQLEGGGDPSGRVVAVSRGAGMPRSQRVGADGSYRFDGLMPGHYRVKLVDEEILPGRSSSAVDRQRPVGAMSTDCEVRGGQTARFDLRVVPPRVQVAGQLQLAGEDMRRWHLQILPDGAPRLPMPEPIPLAEDGRFRGEISRPGTAKLIFGRADARGTGLVLRRELRSGDNEISLTLQTGSVRGRQVTAHTGRERSMLRVRGAGFEYRAALPATAGPFRIESVPAGQVEVRRGKAAVDLARWTLLGRGKLESGGKLDFDLP